MTAITNVTVAGDAPLFSVASIKEGPGNYAPMPSGIFCIGALTAPDGQFLMLSLVGRQTAFQEFRGLMSTGKLKSFIIHQDDGEEISGWFSHEWLGKMEYHGAKLQTSLFGELTQMIMYHPLMTTPDKANQKAAVPFMGVATDDDMWNVVKHISEIPLLDSWQSAVMQLLIASGWFKPLLGFGCNAGYVELGDTMGNMVSANIRAGALTVDGVNRDKLVFDPSLWEKTSPAQPAPASEPEPEPNVFGEVIHAYTRANAIDDGFLVDVSHTSEAGDAGFRVPVALTREAWERYAEWDNAYISPQQQRLGQSTAGRLWDVMYMASRAIYGNNGKNPTLLYRFLAIPKDGRSTEAALQTLKIHSGAGDNGEHVITIMLPNED